MTMSLIFRLLEWYVAESLIDMTLEDEELPLPLLPLDVLAFDPPDAPVSLLVDFVAASLEPLAVPALAAPQPCSHSKPRPACLA